MNNKSLYHVVYKPDGSSAEKRTYICMAKHTLEARVFARVACGIGIVILKVSKAPKGGESHVEND